MSLTVVARVDGLMNRDPSVKRRPVRPVVLAGLAMLGLAPAVEAAILFDFGPTATTGTDALLSPGHATGAVPGGEATWNTIGATNPVTTIVNADGTSATGVAIDLGASATNGTTINFASAINGGSLTGSSPTNTADGTIYQGTAPGRDGIFGNGASNTTDVKVGAQITGLAAGTYTVYVTGRNTNNGAASVPETFYVGVAAPTTGTYDFTADASAAATNPLNAGLVAFEEGVNYASFDVTVADGQALYVVADGTAGAEPRGFLNTIELVTPAVPEPATAGLLVFAAAPLLGRRNRRR